MSRAPDLVLLTSSFPYGNKAETFLEAELPVLARRFPRVFVLPSHREDGVRPLPGNARLVEMPWLEGYGTGARLRALFSPEAASIWTRTLAASGNAGPYLRHARVYADLLARQILRGRELVRYLRAEGLEDAVGYDYWFENATLALGLARRRGALRVAVCRAHGFDVYDDRWSQGRVPFREAKARRMDRVFAVSSHGAGYLRDRLGAHGGRVTVARLGVARQDPAPPPPDPADVPPLILTCGSLLPFKGIHRVPRVLARMGRPIRWVHLGDGPERRRVEAEARARLGPGVAWSLRGHVDHGEVLRFYRENAVDALLSLSSSEGLPVSMMEALSFGVPVVALGVNGVPELVGARTGVLLSPEADDGEVAAALTWALEDDRFDSEGIRAFFLERFEAEANYNAFADALLALWQDQAPPG